jgi:hypothetical protein
MPNLAGTDLLREVADGRSLLARARFVVVTARHGALATADALLTRLDVVRVRKPFEPDGLLTAVRSAAARLAP